MRKKIGNRSIIKGKKLYKTVFFVGGNVHLFICCASICSHFHLESVFDEIGVNVFCEFLECNEPLARDFEGTISIVGLIFPFADNFAAKSEFPKGIFFDPAGVPDVLRSYCTCCCYWYPYRFESFYDYG